MMLTTEPFFLLTDLSTKRFLTWCSNVDSYSPPLPPKLAPPLPPFHRWVTLYSIAFPFFFFPSFFQPFSSRLRGCHSGLVSRPSLFRNNLLAVLVVYPSLITPRDTFSRLRVSPPLFPRRQLVSQFFFPCARQTPLHLVPPPQLFPSPFYPIPLTRGRPDDFGPILNLWAPCEFHSEVFPLVPPTLTPPQCAAISPPRVLSSFSLLFQPP